jgi:hypothetical protein
MLIYTQLYAKKYKYINNTKSWWTDTNDSNDSD